MTWRTFMRAHWPVLYSTAFVIELHSRRVRIIGTSPHPDEAFVLQTLRQCANDVDGVLRAGRILICDRDPKWSREMEHLLNTVGVRVVRTPARAPNSNAHAERFVRSIKDECLNRIVPLGERHLRRMLAEFSAHYHHERNHQGLENELIERVPVQRTGGPVHRRQRAGGVLNYYYRSAA
jgi:putative transposase